MAPREGVVCLRSVVHCAKPIHVGVLEDGSIKPATQTGMGRHGRFRVIVVERTAADLLPTGAVVCLQSASSKANLRIMNDGSVNGKGGRGNLARFKVHRVGDLVKLQRADAQGNSRFLRIRPDHVLDGAGSGGAFTLFCPVIHADQSLSLRSAVFKDKALHVGIVGNGDAKAPRSTGMGPNGRFSVQLISKPEAPPAYQGKPAAEQKKPANAGKCCNKSITVTTPKQLV